MAFVDNYDVEEIARDTLENLVFFIGTGDGLIQSQIHFIGRVDFAVFDFCHDRAEGLEIIDEGLVDEDVSIRQKEYTLDHAGLPKAPDNLKGGVGLAGTRRHDEQHSPFTAGDRFYRAVDRLDLVVAWLFAGRVIVVGLDDQFLSFIFNTAELLVTLP